MPLSTVALTTGGKRDASTTTRLSAGGDSGNVARPSTRTNLPSCAETMRSAAVADANPAASSDATASVVHEPRIAILPLAFEGAKATAIAGAVPARKPGRRAMSLRGAAPSVALGARSAVAQRPAIDLVGCLALVGRRLAALDVVARAAHHVARRTGAAIGRLVALVRQARCGLAVDVGVAVGTGRSRAIDATGSGALGNGSGRRRRLARARRVHV